MKTALERLRAICGRLPGSIETTTFGHPTFQAGPKKTFVVLDDHERKGSLAIVFKTSVEHQRKLTRRDQFFPSKFGAKHGWTSLIVSDDVDWNEVAALVTASYRMFATQRMLAALDDEARA
jgi:predicted DNA-binding protein (MmcQ/YjbR family)